MFLRDLHEAAGARFAPDGGRIRHYGEPDAEYRAATGGLAVLDRSHRGRLRAEGRDPRGMLAGVLTGRMPAPLEARAPDLLVGVAEPSAMLTPKGRMVSEMRVIPEPDDDALLLDLETGVQAALEHFTRYVPPRLAKIRDASDEVGMITVVGPGAPAVLSRDALGLRVESADLEAQPEGRAVRVGPAERGVTVVRTGEVAAPAWDVLADPATVRALWATVVDGGAVPMGLSAWEVLRIEAGRPLFGTDMDERTIPVEAGVHERVIDYAKGCFTGQEVIIRIRDRGRVNRHLRGLILGDEAVASGTELFGDGEKAAGWVTSAAESPRFGSVIGLGYVRREVVPPARVRVGSPDGPEAEVRDLGSDWAPPLGD